MSEQSENTTMKKIVMGVRILFGLLFLVFGLNGFLHFMKLPSMPKDAGAFLGALAATKYMFPFIKGTEVVTGLMLISGRFVPLALVILAPVLLNIFAFHLFLDFGGIGVTMVFVVMELFLLWSYRAYFRGIFTAKAEV